MTVKIGHASINERNKVSDGTAGDQTGKEVCVRDWYNKTGGWTTVFRAKNANDAEKIATAMEQACLNDNIGYDQSQRTTLFAKAKELDWNISKVTDKCECDCSSLVAVCVNAAGIKVSKGMYTGNQKILLNSTGKFNLLTESKYLSKSDYLKRGDILLGQGHTAIVLLDGALAVPTNETGTDTVVAVSKPIKNIGTTVGNIKKIDTAKSFLKGFAGTYTVTASGLNVRQGAGTLKPVITTITKGTKVKCYGYYTKILGITWLYIQFTQNGIQYTGFASSQYLVKV